jgi:hypothetical protein
MEVDLTVLSPDEVLLLKNLLKKSKIPSSKITPKNTLKAYKLQVIYQCRTCQQQTSTFYDMVENESKTGLTAVKTTDETMSPKDVINERSCMICPLCRQFLLTLTKEELIDKYITLASMR